MEGWENVVGKWSVGIWLLYPSITSCSTPLHDFQKLLISHNDSYFENEIFFTMQREIFQQGREFWSKKTNGEEKEEKLRRQRRKHFHRRKRRARKRCNRNLVGHQRNNQNRKKMRGQLVSQSMPIFWSLPLFQPFWNKKYRVLCFTKKSMMYIIRLKRILYISNVLGLCNSFCKTNLNHSPVVDFSFTYTCVIIICWPQNRMMYKCPWTLQQILQKQSSSFYSGQFQLHQYVL